MRTADQAQEARTMPDRSISQVARNARVTSPHPARRLVRRSPIGDTSCPRNGVATARAYTRVVLRRWIGITARVHGSACATAGCGAADCDLEGHCPACPRTPSICVTPDSLSAAAFGGRATVAGASAVHCTTAVQRDSMRLKVMCSGTRSVPAVNGFRPACARLIGCPLTPPDRK